MSIQIGILGSGAMATACALILAENPGHSITMLARSAELAAEMDASRENRRLLPGFPLPGSIRVTAEPERMMRGAEFLVTAVPSQFLRNALAPLRPLMAPSLPIVSVIKGIENGTLMRPSEIVADALGTRQTVALSGPSHAEELARRLPATLVAAADDLTLARRVQRLFNTERFRVYTNLDLIGVELAGALKNVIAIASGISDGLEYGDNAKSALLTRGLVEMTRFGVRFGAEAATFAGLAGMGDLITTCVSPFGRNRTVGLRLGRGESIAAILASMQAVAEGVATSRSIYDIGEQEGLDLPITREVFEVLFRGKPVTRAVDTLMMRPLRSE